MKQITLDSKVFEEYHNSEFSEADIELGRPLKILNLIILNESYMFETYSKFKKNGFNNASYNSLISLGDSLTNIYKDLQELVTEDMFNRNNDMSKLYFTRFENMYKEIMPQLENELEKIKNGERK